MNRTASSIAVAAWPLALLALVACSRSSTAPDGKAAADPAVASVRPVDVASSAPASAPVVDVAASASAHLLDVAAAASAHPLAVTGLARSADAAAGKAFGAPCVADGECAGQVCFHKRIKGPDSGAERRGSNEAVEHDGYCSLHCNQDGDCPVPLTRGKCGARGMCKRAD